MEKLIVGTEKGGYVLTKGASDWSVEGPSFPGWKVSAFGKAPDGTYLAGLGSNWFGASVHRSNDLKEWQQVEKGPSYSEDSGLKLNQVWMFHTVKDGGGRIYAGVDQAGLFLSDDQGLSWEPVPSLNQYPGREEWQPGFGGLAAHHILSAGHQLWVGISAVGVFRSDDGGKSFSRHDRGVTSVLDPEGDPEAVDPGRCVHGLVADRNDPNRIWRQDHTGVYRSGDGGDSWERIEEGLPARFGFAIGRNHQTESLFVAPLTADENRVPVDGHLAVYRSQDDGKSWHQSGTGWPTAGQFNGVLRNAMSVDSQGGVAIGTTGGSLFTSDDDGGTWSQIPVSLPRILAVEAA